MNVAQQKPPFAGSLAETPLEKVILAALEGMYLEKCDDIPEVLECFKRGPELNPSDVWLLLSIADGLIELAAQANELPVAAIEHFDRAIEQQPSQPILAQLHHQKGNVLHHQLESEADKLEPGWREMAMTVWACFVGVFLPRALVHRRGKPTGQARGRHPAYPQPPRPRVVSLPGLCTRSGSSAK